MDTERVNKQLVKGYPIIETGPIIYASPMTETSYKNHMYQFKLYCHIFKILLNIMNNMFLVKVFSYLII